METAKQNVLLFKINIRNIDRHRDQLPKSSHFVVKDHLPWQNRLWICLAINIRRKTFWKKIQTGVFSPLKAKYIFKKTTHLKVLSVLHPLSTSWCSLSSDVLTPSLHPGCSSLLTAVCWCPISPSLPYRCHPKAHNGSGRGRRTASSLGEMLWGTTANCWHHTGDVPFIKAWLTDISRADSEGRLESYPVQRGHQVPSHWMVLWG